MLPSMLNSFFYRYYCLVLDNMKIFFTFIDGKEVDLKCKGDHDFGYWSCYFKPICWEGSHMIKAQILQRQLIKECNNQAYNKAPNPRHTNKRHELKLFNFLNKRQRHLQYRHNQHNKPLTKIELSFSLFPYFFWYLMYCLFDDGEFNDAHTDVFV